MRISLLGDVMLGRGVGAQIPRREPESFWGDTLATLHAADLVVANLECAITTHAVPWTRTPKVFHFRAPPEAVEVLAAAEIRLVSLANNHILDFEVQGLRDTLGHLDRAGIARAGAGENLDEAARPAIVEAAGERVAMIAATDNERGWAAGPDTPGVQWLRFDPDERASLGAVERGVETARAGGAAVVILSLHWGPNMVERPPRRFREFAREAIERGVDIVHGHSAHIFQGVGVHRGRPILFDTGDVIDDYVVDPRLRNDQSLIFVVDVDEAGPRELKMIPLRLRYAGTALASGRDVEEIGARMAARSDELGTRVEERDGALVVDLREDA